MIDHHYNLRIYYESSSLISLCFQSIDYFYRWFPIKIHSTAYVLRVLCFIHYIRTIQIIVIILISTHCSVTINYYAFYNLYSRIISNFLNSCYTLSVKSFWTFHVIDHFFPGVRRGLFFLLISGFATGRVFFLIESKKTTFFRIHARLEFSTTWKPHRFFSKIFYSFLELNIYYLSYIFL